MNPETRIIPIFVSHMGCPNQCVFCDQRTISGTPNPMTPLLAEAHVESVLEMQQNSVLGMQHLEMRHPQMQQNKEPYEIAYFGGSFTGISPELQEAYLSVAKKRSLPVRISTRPDYIDDVTLDRLARYNVKLIELGVQSMDNTILTASGRGHTAEQTIKACEKIHQHGFSLGIQTMIGLPGESKETVMDTARRVEALNPDVIRIYPVLVIKGTILENWMNSGRYVPLTLEEAVEMTASALSYYRDKGRKVIRVGLQSSDEISAGKDSKVCGGPIHPAFRQLVEATILVGKIAPYPFDFILCGKKVIDLLTGHHRYGANKLMGLTGCKNPDIRVSSECGPEEIKLFLNGLHDMITIML